MNKSLIDYNTTMKFLDSKYLENTLYKRISSKSYDKNAFYPNNLYHQIDNAKSSYPHSMQFKEPDLKINDKIFRNAQSNVGLGYYSLE